MLTATSGIDTSDLRVVHNPLELRRHLPIYVDYVSRRSVKRTYRGNNLSDGDQARLCQLMQAPDTWLPVVETAATRLGLVTWSTEARDHDRSGPLYPDNYVHTSADAVSRYWKQPLLEAEHLLQEALMTSGQSEFVARLHVGALDRFSSYSVSRRITSLNYARARHVLLQVLSELSPDTWHGVAALVECVKRSRPDFLFDSQESHLCDLEVRHKGGYADREVLNGKGPDWFERREGRYIERFLEGFPLLLGYLDVAYGAPLTDADVTPSMGSLKAFRLRNTLRQVLRKTLPAPRVRVQPNFEMQIESPVPAVGLVRTLSALGEVVADDVVSIVRLRRDRVGEWGIANPPQSLVPWLSELNGQPLPANVRTELEDWVAQSEQFTVYKNYGVLEGEAPKSVLIAHGAIPVAAGIHLVEKPTDVHAALEAAALVPIHVRHPLEGLALAPGRAVTRFPQAQLKVPGKGQKGAARKTVTVRREATLRLHISDTEYRDKLQARLVEVRCPVQRDGAALVYSDRHEKEVEQAMDTFKRHYRVVEDKA